jgi:hypothetical protein
MAIRKTIEIDVNAKSAIKSLEELGGSFEDANGEGAIPLSTTIGELEDRLYAMAAAGDTASKEFTEISGQVGKMKKVIIDTDLTLDGMSQNLAQNVGGALTGVASGFSLAQGAMGAFGGGSEAVEESLLKVQSAMAMAQGLQGLKESIGSFKALKASIMASTVVQKVLNVVMSLNPIGLIILAVAALGAAIALLFSPIKKLLQFMGFLAADAETAAEANKRITATIEAQAAALDKLKTKQAQQHSDRMRQLKLQGASAKEIHEEILKNLKNEEVNRKKSIEDSKKNVKDLQKAWKKALKSGDEENRKSLAEKLNAEKKNVRLLSGQYKQYTLSKQEEDQRYNEKKESDDKAATDKEKAELETRRSNYKAYLDKKLAAERRIEDLKNGLIKDDEEKALAIRKTKFARDIEDLKTTGELGNETRRLLEEQLQLDLIKITSDAMPEKLAIKTIEIDIEKEGNRQILVDYAEKAKQKEAIDKEEAKKQKALDREVTDAKLSLASTSFGALGDLASAFASNNEKSQKRAFQINKAVQLAQAVISTYQGANAIFATAAANPASVLFPAQPFIMAGAAIVSGLANVATIARTQFSGGASGGGGGASAPPSIGGGSSPASFNVVGNTGINQLAEGLGNQNQQPVQAFVVGSEVTTQQSLDRNKIETATI